MAVEHGDYSASNALKKLEEQLSCPICFEGFTNPKILPCFHSFCLHCLEGIQPDLVQGNHFLLCPTCRSPCQLPDQGVAGLPLSFTINNLREVYDLLKKVLGSQCASCDKCGSDSAVRYCAQCRMFLCQDCLRHHDDWTTNHMTLNLEEVANTAYQLPSTKPNAQVLCTDHDKSLEIFCETCDELICHLCTVKKHRDHDYDVVSDAYNKHKLGIESNLQPLDQQINRLNEAVNDLVTRRKEILQQGDTAKQKVHQTIERLKRFLDREEKKLIQEVDSALENKLGVMDQQIKETEAAVGKLIECRNYIQQTLKLGTPHQVLSTKSQMIDRTNRLVKSTDSNKFQPLEQTDIELEIREDINQIQRHSIGTVSYNCCPTSVKVSFLSIPLEGKEATVTLYLSTPGPIPSSSIHCQLTSPTKNVPIDHVFKETKQPGEFEIIFTPSARGLHRLCLAVSGTEIPGSVANIPVSAAPNVRENLIQIITVLKRPVGVAITDDGIMVASDFNSHCIAMFSQEGKAVNMTGSNGRGLGQLSHPDGVAISIKGNILVVDRDNHRIQEFSINGKWLSSFGTKGNGQLQFKYPSGIAVSKATGEVYVVDSSNNRIQVLNKDLSFSHMFGSRGSGHGQFRNPYDIALDSEGFVYVADHDNHRIQKFNSKGQYVISFGTKGSQPGHLEKPSGISVYKDLLYVSVAGRVCILTTAGDFMQCFGEEKLQNPYRSAFDKQGCFFVCDDGDGYIKKF